MPLRAAELLTPWRGWGPGRERAWSTVRRAAGERWLLRKVAAPNQRAAAGPAAAIGRPSGEPSGRSDLGKIDRVEEAEADAARRRAEDGARQRHHRGRGGPTTSPRRTLKAIGWMPSGRR